MDRAEDTPSAPGDSEDTNNVRETETTTSVASQKEEDREGTERGNGEKQEGTDDSEPNPSKGIQGGEDGLGEDEPSAPVLVDTRVVRLKMDELNPHLVCRICSGYYREAHTITECLHTFCKSCLLLAFDKGMRSCPHCKVDLGPHPINMILYDRTMQELVNKILPDLEAEDQAKEEAFYQARGIKRKPTEDKMAPASSASTSSTSSSSSSTRGCGSGTGKRSKSNQQSEAPAEVEMNFKLSPDVAGSGFGTTEDMVLPALEKPFLKTSGKLKVLQLKKYVAKHLLGGDEASEDVEILCNGESLGPELSLYFIKCTRWMQGDALSLLLNYRRRAKWS